MANEDGVWRTVGGRRIFIKKGQNLSDAMKESGKFGSSTKKKALGKGLNDIEQENADGEGLKKLLGKDREEQAKINQDYIKEQSKLAKEKENKDTAERKKALDELREYSGMDADNAETYNASLEEIKGRTEQLKKEFEKQESSKNIVDEVNESNREYAKKKAEEYRNTKDPMFQDVKEERARDYEKQAKRLGKGLNDLEKDNKDGANKLFETGTKDEPVGEVTREEKRAETIKADVGKHKVPKSIENQLLSDSVNNRARGITELTEYVAEQEEWVDVTAHYYGGNAFQIEDRDGNPIDIGMGDYTYEKINQKIADHYEKKNNNQDWVKKAFQEYKKEHKNTKLTLDDFRKQQK